MLRFIYTLLLLTISSIGISQVGNGVLFMTDAEYQFPGTTVDSTSTFEFQVVNDLGAPQTIFFSALDAPFSLLDNSPLEIPANDSSSVTLLFQPSEVGEFSGTLEAVGSVFGSASFDFSGNGIQVLLEWTPESLSFDTTAIMQTSTADIVFENVGQGDAVIEAINDPSGHFTVEFIDTYVAPVVEECFEYNNTIFYNYYLTVDLGSNPGNTYWYIQDNYGFNGWGGNYEESADSLEVCLPYDGSPTQQSIYVNFFNYGSGQDASMQLQDIYGNVVWSIELGADDNYYEYSIDFLLPLGEAPAPPEFEPGIIAEGSSQTARISFIPTYAGDVAGEVQFLTNSPVNPAIQVPTFGVGISEIGGEVCDMVLDSANSPYFLVADLEVSEGCSLTIEAGVEIIGEAYDIICFGSLFALGTEASPVTIAVSEIVSHSEQFEMHHCEIVEHSTSPGLDSDLRIVRDESGVSTNSELAEFLGSYSTASLDADWYLENVSPQIELDLENEAVHFDNFTNTNTCGEWYSTDNDVTISCDGLVQGYHNYCGCWHGWDVYSPVYSIPADRLNGFSKVQFDYSSFGSSNSNNYNNSFHYLIDGGEGDNNPGWQSFDNWFSNYAKSGNFSYELNSPEFETDFNEDGIITIQFYYYIYGLYQSYQTIDNFQLSSGPIEDAEDFFEDAEAFENSISDDLGFLSTGSVSIHNCNVQGDIEVVGFDNEVLVENCTITGGQGGLAIYSDEVNMQVTNSTINLQNFDGVRVYSSAGDIHIDETLIYGNTGNGIQIDGGLSFHLAGSEIFSNQQNGIVLRDIEDTELNHCQINTNWKSGILSDGGASLEISSSILASNDLYGVKSNRSVNLNFSTLAFNEATGVKLLSNNFHNIQNSILWGNDGVSYVQVSIEGGVVSTSYSSIQGASSYGIDGNGQLYLGAGTIEVDPLFEEFSFHLNSFSPCVDGGQPWLMDAHMPYGLGGVRADMGAYGGPDNAYWGGLALPDGASSLLTVQDSPQDQGNSVGLTFSSSFYDNSELVNNVTHYAFWRHFDPTGAPITDVAEGNWELLGEMPSLSLNNYAYQAPTLGNTNAFGDFSSCYFVAAHTADDDTYWISNVMCGESVDNLAPDDPDLNGLVLESGEAQISWTPPTEEDYAYTEIYNDDGFTAEVGNDTLVLDPSVIPGYTYTYTAVNYDVNGNASDASSLTLEIPAGLDIIPLTAGWNLISTDRSASTPAIEDVLSSLDEGNVEYVTGFNNGVVLYDPDGFFLFNTLDEFESGYGYWIKVQEDDTLEIAGSLLTDGYMPSLNMGWNLIGYPNAESSSVEAYLDQMLSDEALEYVTGFNQGSSYFDPNGLPFLNSLVELENGFGYWLKVSQAYDFNSLVADQVDEPLAALSGASGVTQPNPNYMLLNGTSNLAQESGKQVLVHALDGTVVGALPILKGGYLMTTALYGDDPATEAFEGLQAGDEVYFSFEGKRSKEAVVYNGQMELRHINLEFEVQSLFEVFPNPFAEAITISGVLEAGGLLDAVITDSQGRVVAQRPAIEMTAGSYSLDWQLPRLAPGYYNCTLRVDGVTLDSMPIMHVEQ